MLRFSRLVGVVYLLICLGALGGTFLLGPLGYAPIPLGPARAPVVVTIWYGTEKQAWLEEAARQFEASQPTVGGRPVQIHLVGLGSREAALRIAGRDWREDGAPTVFSPASSLWVEVLKDEWSKRGGQGQIIAAGSDAPRPLVLTPLVFAVWEQRAKVLWPERSDFWQRLHGVIANPGGWSALPGGRAEWGDVKLGHTSPLTSNSGAQALVLMAYGYTGKASGLTRANIDDPALQRWIAEIESGVPEFGDSTGTFMTDLVRFGPSKYDLAMVYENLALEQIEAAEKRWNDRLLLVYPPATIVSDHPYALLDAPWTTPQQREAAARFRSFLLSRPAQELALRYGFRPADPAVPLTSDGSPFERYRSNGVQTTIADQIATPSGETINALLDFWQRSIGR